MTTTSSAPVDGGAPTLWAETDAAEPHAVAAVVSEATNPNMPERPVVAELEPVELDDHHSRRSAERHFGQRPPGGDERGGDAAWPGRTPLVPDRIGRGSNEQGYAALTPRLVTVVDAARLLGIGRSTLYELIAAGDIEVVHIRRSVRVPLKVVDAYIERLQKRGEALDGRPRPARGVDVTGQP